MFAIGIRYLNGWSMATNTADRERPEWPPHPDRVFMALVAAHYETDGNDGESKALLWLERQEPPNMWASDFSQRKAITSYVPVNDETTWQNPDRPGSKPRAIPSAAGLIKAKGVSEKLKKLKSSGLGVLPEHRSRQPRQFPVAIPHDPQVYFVWPEPPSPEVRVGLESLCSKVVRIGHSASLVQAWVDDAPPEPNLIPTPAVDQHSLRVSADRVVDINTGEIFPQHLRVSAPGRLEHLKTQYESGLRPERSRWVAYSRPQPESQPTVPGSVFHGQLLVLRRVNGRQMRLESTLILTNKLHNAVLKHCPKPVPEWISGHTRDSQPSQKPHLAFLPLPFVNHEHADGHLLGLALAMPKHLEPAEVARYLNPVMGFEKDGSLRRVRLYNGANFDWFLEIEDRVSPPVALQSEVWTRPARHWATVTPIAFDRHAKGRDKDRQEKRMVEKACERIGLPRPVEVALSQASLHTGVPHSRSFPVIRRKSDGGQLRHFHAAITFEREVRGPVILGAGRYRGYGLFRPV